MNPVLIIKKKRDGGKLNPDEIAYMVSGASDGSIPDYQLASWLMASFLKGLDSKETTSLVNSMLNSGTIVDLSEIKGFKVDKHSTGGVGDKPSLVIAPVVASLGAIVPMVSGRGLGHTGGTLDKLESINGFKTDISLKRYKEILKEISIAMIGQTAEIAPADRKLYSLRDVTGTVESIPLICASIMSKKLAEGIDGLLFDVKFGSGAFMKKYDDAKALATLLVEIGRRSGKKATALITDMNQPLGRMIGNSLEAIESIEVLKGSGPDDMKKICAELSAHMLLIAGVAGSVEEGIKKYDEAISSGKALERFAKLVSMQGGDARLVYDPKKFKLAKLRHELRFKDSGYIRAIETEKVGLAAVELGAGRRQIKDKVDPSVGIEWNCRIGDRVSSGDTAAIIYYNDGQRLNGALKLLDGAIEVGDKVDQRPLVYEVVE